MRQVLAPTKRYKLYLQQLLYVSQVQYNIETRHVI